MILHLIQRSPFSSTALTDCLNIIGTQDSILFMQDGVYALSHQVLNNIDNSCHFLKDDITARGINHDSQIELASYQNFVSLCSQHDKIISWF